MDFFQKRKLGQTDLMVGPLGVAASFGAETEAFEEAFEKGCNYFYWGSMRKSGMANAIMNICGKGKRDELAVVIQTYSRSAALMELFFKRALRTLKIDYSDVLLLGWYNKPPSNRILERALRMKEQGLCRYLGLSGHNRSLFPELAKTGVFDLFHVRYNAAHRGAEKDIFPHLGSEGRPGIVSYTATRWGQLLNKKRIPDEEEVPSASSCYRFALSNPNVDVCMCGPKNENQMQEALKTLDLGPLDEDELERMRRIGDYVHAHTGKFF
ncbi:aldo/keto reductase [Thermodesulfobacteriota bacterium]